MFSVKEANSATLRCPLNFHWWWCVILVGRCIPNPPLKSGRSNDSAWNIRWFLIREALRSLKWLECFGSSKPLSEKPLYAMFWTLYFFRRPLTPVDTAEQKHHEIVPVLLMTLPVKDTGCSNLFLFQYYRRYLLVQPASFFLQFSWQILELSSWFVPSFLVEINLCTAWLFTIY